MKEDRLRPTDINGYPIVLGDWYWAYDRIGRLVGAGKVLATIGQHATLSFVINQTGYYAGNFQYVPIAFQPEGEPRPRADMGSSIRPAQLTERQLYEIYWRFVETTIPPKVVVELLAHIAWLEAENKKLDTVLSEESKHVEPLIAALNSIGVLVDGTLDSYNERNKERAKP